MATKRIVVEGIGGVKLSSDAEFDNWLKRKGVACLIDDEGDEIGGFGTLVNGSSYTVGQSQQPQQDLRVSGKRKADEVADVAAAILVRRMELASKRGRPQRTLSYVASSHAFPARVESTAGEILIIQSFAGEGATSRVFVASRGENIGVVKMLKPGHEACASREVSVLR